MSQLSVIITAISVLIAAIIGAILSKWLSRSKVWVGITSIDRDDTELVDLPPEALKLSRSSHYNVRFGNQQVPLHEVVSVYSNSGVILKILKESIEILNKFSKKIEEGFSSDEEKRQNFSQMI